MATNGRDIQPIPGRCLLPLLQPVRHCLHAFLSAAAAAQLMRASRSIAASLLADYAVVDHRFTCLTIADVKRKTAFYGRYRMRIARLCLPLDWREPLIDSTTGLSCLPPSLTALSLGPVTLYRLRGWVAEALLDEGSEASECEIELCRYIRAIELQRGIDAAWGPGHQCGAACGHFNQPIPPGALPSGLRIVQLGGHFNQPLHPRSIPDGVEVLQLSTNYTRRLEVGHLPASITQLMLGRNFNHPLPPGALPAGLKQLQLCFNYNQPIAPGVLPAQLQKLSLGHDYNQPLLPGLIPASVTHLCLSYCYNQPLQSGSIPHGAVCLQLGVSFNQPLPPGVLPTSLRVLLLHHCYSQPLLPGSLPEGLDIFAFSRKSGYQQALQPGVIPASVSVVSLGKAYKQELLAGAIPATVRWLRLPRSHAERDLSGVLSPSTTIVWWES